MPKEIPRIQKYMTHSPQTISGTQTIQVAKQMMNSLGIRHLPVMQDGKLMGVVSGRDIRLLEFWSGTDVHKSPVKEAVSPEPFSASADTPLNEVVRVMIEKNYGSTIISEGDRILGIFTVTDALRALLDLLEEK